MGGAASYAGTKHFSQQDIHSANATGFGAAADDYSERGIDLNEQLVYNKTATFFFSMNSEAMEQSGIRRDDILVVDRSLSPVSGKIIVAVVNGEMMVRRVLHTFNRLWLMADSNDFQDIEITEGTEFRCWGVVTCVIHIFEPVLKGSGTGKRAAPGRRPRKN